MNPTNGTGIADADVTSYRFCLIESDCVPFAEQGALVMKLRDALPVTAIIATGGKSLHAWVAVNAVDVAEYRQTVKDLLKVLEPFGVDQANKNPSRLSRLPGAIRNSNTQRLIYFDPDAATRRLDLAALRPMLATVTTVKSIGATAEPGQKADNKPVELITSVDAADLFEMQIEPPRWIAKGLLAEGITIIGGKPKIGKSWLCLGMALDIIAGKAVLERYPAHKAEVLYLALEDNRARLQDRLRTLCGSTPPPGLRFITADANFAKLDKGGLEQLRLHVQRYPETRCIFIDTLQKIKPTGHRNGNAYENDVDAIGALHRFSLEHRVAVVLVHHLRKSGAEDVFDELSGSLGLTGSADTNIVIRRQRGSGQAVMHVTGRAIKDDLELALTFDKARWTVQGNANDIRGGENRQAIRNIIRDAGRDLTAREIHSELEATGTDMTLANVKMTLGRMTTDGQVYRDAKTHRYSLIGLESIENAVTSVIELPATTVTRNSNSNTNQRDIPLTLFGE